MPISARLSLWGLYQYDNTILDNLTVPTGLDVNNIKQNLLVETAGMTVLYPDPNFLKVAIELWSTERQDIWQKLYNTTLLTYDPVENYDRFEETEEKSDGVSVRENEHSRNAASSGVAVRDNEQSRDSDSSALNSDISTQSGNSQTTNANTAYDSNTFADTSKSTSNGTNNTSNSGTSSSNSHDSITSGEKESRNENSSEKLNESGNESNSNVRKFSSHIHGNIGVKTASAMIMEAREEMQFCMTEYIINDFINKFCVMVY